MSLGASIQPDCSHPEQLGPVAPATQPALPAAAAPTPPPPTPAAAAAEEALMIQRLVLEELVKSSCGL